MASGGRSVNAPVRLPANQFPRFYRGGARLDALRGLPEQQDHRPEDWVGSTTTALGEERHGLSALPDGRLLRDAIRADPEAFLGPAHVRRYGADPALLVKLLDAGERLPVHFHPGRAFAARHLGLGYGKTEAWIIVDADPGAAVHVGLEEAIDVVTLRRWVAQQDAEEMLAALSPVTVRPGDAVFVPAGTLHAIGAGVLLVELQEPTDLSVLLEWRRFGVDDGAAHLGLGWDVALAAAELEPTPEASRAGTDLLPSDADPYFRAQRVQPAGGEVELEPSFAILIAVRGTGALHTERGDSLPLARGDTVLVPFAAGATAITGGVEVIRCLPPTPDVGDGRW
jgi:mannose-6-phosphate isomerase